MLPHLEQLKIKEILIILIVLIILIKKVRAAQVRSTNNVMVSSWFYAGLRGFCPRKKIVKISCLSTSCPHILSNVDRRQKVLWYFFSIFVDKNKDRCHLNDGIFCLPILE